MADYAYANPPYAFPGNSPCPRCSPFYTTSVPFTLVAAVAIEFTLIRQELTVASARRLRVTDIVLGVAAGALLIVGGLRVVFFEKGFDYYLHSTAFWAKLALFVAIRALSVIPTQEFLSWSASIKAGRAPVHRRRAQAPGVDDHPR